MAKSENRVSITKYDAVTKEHFNQDTVINWHGVDVKVKRNLSLKEMLTFVRDVVEVSFGDNYGYMPELTDLIVKSNILTMYANFRLPEDLERRYEMIYATDAVEMVTKNINTEQLNEIIRAINTKIRFACDTRTREIEARVNDVVNTLEELKTNTEKVFSGVSQEDLKNLLGAVANGGVDEEKLVHAYMSETKKDGETA